MAGPLDHPTTRRGALRAGGLAATLGVLAAACGEDRGGSAEAGRVGNAPGVTALPNYEVTDAVYLRTASSLEYTVVDALTTALGLEGAVPEELRPLLERLVADHEQVASRMESLTSEAGGEPWSCANPWLIERLVMPVFESILSPVIGIVAPEDPSLVQVLGEQLPLGDTVTTSRGELRQRAERGELSEGEVGFERYEGDVGVDVLAFLTALEDLAAASHQELALTDTYTEARTAHAEAAALAAQHASWLAMRTGGDYVSPEVLGEEAERTELGGLPSFAIPSVFGLVSQIDFIAGPGDQNGVRPSFALQTPAANSLVYDELTCDAG